MNNLHPHPLQVPSSHRVELVEREEVRGEEGMVPLVVVEKYEQVLDETDRREFLPLIVFRKAQDKPVKVEVASHSTTKISHEEMEPKQKTKEETQVQEETDIKKIEIKEETEVKAAVEMGDTKSEEKKDTTESNSIQIKGSYEKCENN